MSWNGAHIDIFRVKKRWLLRKRQLMILLIYLKFKDNFSKNYKNEFFKNKCWINDIFVYFYKIRKTKIIIRYSFNQIRILEVV